MEGGQLGSTSEVRTRMYMRTKDSRAVSKTPEENVYSAIDYISAHYAGEESDVTYWEQEHHPERLAVPEREAWHRDAWDKEQRELEGIIRQRPRVTDQQVLRASFEQ
jgi:hypothetical protein